MAETPRLDLPYLAASQAQKEVYHNQSLDRLDLLCQCAVLDRSLSTPPSSPALGDAYIVATGGTGAWAGHDHHLALYVSSQWQLIAPLPGFQCWILDEAVLVYWSGTAWTIITSGGGGATTFLGLTDTPDTYTGQAGKAVLVNAGGTALEFGTTGGGAPPDATYIVSTSNATLTAERVLTDNTQITWDLATAGQARALLADNGVTLDKLAPLNPSVLLGRGSDTIGDVQPLTVGTGLTIFGTELSATAVGSTTFVGLTDTPDVYTGQGGKAVAVNSGATALEFVPMPTGGGGAPTDAEYITSTTHASLSAERVLTDTATVTWDFTTAGQAKATAVAGENYWTRTAAPPDLSATLQAFWRMEEASGNRLDSVASLALVPTGTPGQAAGKTGNAVNFTGVASTYLSIADQAALSIGAGQDFTIACWVYWNATPSGSQGIVGKGNASVSYNNVEFSLHLSGTSLIFVVGSGSSYVSTAGAGALAASTWYFVVAWYDAAADVQYLQISNGTPTQTANTAGSFDSTGPLEVGRQPQYTGSTAFNGRIDNVMLWKRVLSAAERTALYNSGNGLDYPLPPSIATLTTATAGDQVLLSSTTGLTAERLEVASGIKLGTSTGTTDGILRWSGTRLEIRKGGAWVPLDGTMAEQDASAVAITGGTAHFTAAARATGVVGGQTAAFVAESVAGDSIIGFRSNVAAAGGTGRQSIYTADAPSYFGGTVQVAGSAGVGRAPRSNISLDILWPKTTGTAALYIQQAANDASAERTILFANSATTEVGSIVTTATATSYNTSSDVRLKHNIQPLTNVLECIRALKPISHLWNADGSYGIGFLAHELMTVIPEAVTGLPDEVNPDGSIRPQQVDHSRLIPHLTAGIKELLAMVESLTARVTTLEQALGL